MCGIAGAIDTMAERAVARVSLPKVHQADFKVAMSPLGRDEAVGGHYHVRQLKYLPPLCAVDAAPLPVGVAAARLAGALGAAEEAKARRLQGKGGHRSSAGLVRLQRELFPASLVSDPPGVASTRMAKGKDKTAWPTGCSPGSFAAMATADVPIYLQATLLPDADTLSMASSVGLGVPFVDSHVFSAALESARGWNSAPGKAVIVKALGDRYLAERQTQPRRGFSPPMGPWLTGPLAPLVTAACEPDAPVWSLVDRARAVRAGLMSPHPRRWAETWALTVLDAWLKTWAENPA